MLLKYEGNPTKSSKLYNHVCAWSVFSILYPIVFTKQPSSSIKGNSVNKAAK